MLDIAMVIWRQEGFGPDRFSQQSDLSRADPVEGRFATPAAFSDRRLCGASLAIARTDCWATYESQLTAAAPPRPAAYGKYQERVGEERKWLG